MFSKIISQSSVFLFLILYGGSFLFSQESKQAQFFKKIYGIQYDAAVKSLSNDDKISFSKKVLKDIDSIEKKSNQRYILLKALPLVNNYKSGYPVAIALLQKIVDKNSVYFKLKHLPALCELKSLYAKSILSSKKSEKSEALSKLLESQVMHAKLLYVDNQLRNSVNILKSSQNTAKNLKNKKAVLKIKHIAKILSAKLSQERLYQQKLNIINTNGESADNLEWVGNHVLNEYGDISLATPFMLKSSQGKGFEFIQMYRKFLASNLKASKGPLYFSDKDLDLPNNLLFEYLTVLKETAEKARELKKQYLANNKDAILKALTLGENLIDSGEKVNFKKQAELGQLFMTYIKSIKNPNAQIRLLTLLEDMIKKSIYSDIKLDDAQKTIFKILSKDVNETRKLAIQHEDFIEFDAIPTEIIKPKTFKLKDGAYIRQGLILKGARIIKGLDVSNQKNVKKYSRLFQFSADLKKQNSAMGKWAIINNRVNNKDFQLKCKKETCSIFHSFLNSGKSQNVKFNVISKNLGGVSIFLNGKLMKVVTKDDSKSFELKLSKKQYMLRIVFFHQDRENDGDFSIALKPAKEGQKLALTTSNIAFD